MAKLVLKQSTKAHGPLVSVHGHFGAIRITCLKMACISKMAAHIMHIAKGGKSGVKVDHFVCLALLDSVSRANVVARVSIICPSSVRPSSGKHIFSETIK